MKPKPTAPKRGFFARLFGKKAAAPVYRQYAAVRLPGSSYRPQNWSADTLARSDLDRLRALSRQLGRDNDYMRRFLQQCENNIVGSSGFALQMRVKLDNSDAPDTLANRSIEAAFARWARRGSCEVSGQMSFADVQRLLIRSIARDGEALVRHIHSSSGYQLQILDIDRLDTQYNCDACYGKNAVRMGVEIDSYSRPVAYWLRRDHPGDTASGSTLSSRERIDAADISHIFLHDRPEQRRGFPWNAAALVSLQNLGGYQEAAIIAARIGASKMGFFKQSEDADTFMPPIDGQEQDNGRGKTDLIDTVEPGTFHELPQGYDFTPFNPDYPHANYDAFVKASLRGIASGLGVSYHSLANDLEGVNFSSIRSGTLEERDSWMSLQNWFAENFLYGVFERWLQSALLAGTLRFDSGKALPAAKFEHFNRCNWQGRRWQWVDPLKDISAHEKAVQLGVKSRRAIAAELGMDFDDVLSEIEQENRLMAEKGIEQPQKTSDKETQNESDPEAA